MGVQELEDMLVHLSSLRSSSAPLHSESFVDDAGVRMKTLVYIFGSALMARRAAQNSCKYVANRSQMHMGVGLEQLWSVLLNFVVGCIRITFRLLQSTTYEQILPIMIACNRGAATPQKC